MRKNKYLLLCITLSIFLALSGCNKNEIPQEEITHNAYFLSTDSDFYEKVASNPIDQKYVIDGEAAPLEIWQSALQKCEAWNQQIDFTGSGLESLLSKADYDQLQNAISLWHEYYQEEVNQNRELYGSNGMILGSMYTAISADVLMEKCRLTSFILLSQEYELSGNVSFGENTTTTNNDSEYSLSPQSFCIEYSPDFEETLISYSINEKNSDELEELIHETANKIEEKFGHDFTEHTNKYVSFINALYTIENDISEDSNLCLILKENRLKLYAIELLNIVYMIDGAGETDFQIKKDDEMENLTGEYDYLPDYESLGIQEYEYPLEFSMGENLKTAITQLALSYENFDKDSVSSEDWKEIFVDKFIQNSRSSFDYLDMVAEKNNGQVSADELNYIQYSLTGIELDFSSYEDGSVNRYDAASALNYGWISGYDYEYTDNGVIVTAGFEVGYDGTDSMQEREVTVELVKNPYSCFDGYSVVTVSSKTVASSLEPDGSTHIFYGTDMMSENNGVFAFEFLSSEDDLNYKHFVYVDMTELPELADLVRQNAGKDFKVTFIWNEGNADAIENVVPVDILLDE